MQHAEVRGGCAEVRRGGKVKGERGTCHDFARLAAASRGGRAGHPHDSDRSGQSRGTRCRVTCRIVRAQAGKNKHGEPRRATEKATERDSGKKSILGSRQMQLRRKARAAFFAIRIPPFPSPSVAPRGSPCFKFPSPSPPRTPARPRRTSACGLSSATMQGEQGTGGLRPSALIAGLCVLVPAWVNPGTLIEPPVSLAPEPRSVDGQG